MPGRTALRRFARPMSSLPTEVAAVVYGNVRKQLATALLNAVDIDVTRPMSMSIALREPLETRAGGGKVLDFTTGTGVVAGLAAARGAEEVVAIDASADLLQLATSELAASFKPRVEGETYDSVVKVQSWTDATLQFADETFDAVVLNVEDVADPAAALKESFRVLKKGGKVSFAAWADATPSALRLLIDATGASAADFFPLATEAAAKEARGRRRRLRRRDVCVRGGAGAPAAHDGGAGRRCLPPPARAAAARSRRPTPRRSARSSRAPSRARSWGRGRTRRR